MTQVVCAQTCLLRKLLSVLATFSVDAETLQSVTNILYKTPSHSGLMCMYPPINSYLVMSKLGRS